MLNQFIDILRKEFSEQLLAEDPRVTFGRNQLKLILEKSMSNAALRYLSEAGNTDALEKEEKHATNDS